MVEPIDKNQILEKFKEFAHNIAEGVYADDDDKLSPFGIYCELFDIVKNEPLCK